MNGLLAGKVVLVTGGASGIGRAIAIAAAEHGASVVIVADLRREPKEGGFASKMPPVRAAFSQPPT